MSTRVVRRSTVYALLAILLFGGHEARSQDESVEVSAQQVRAAIDKGKNFLRSVQRANGAWVDTNPYDLGNTALNALALLNCGVPPNDPMLQAPLRHLELQSAQDLTVYVASLRLMVFAAADPTGKRYARQIEQDANYLIQHQVKEGRHVGGWSYGFHIIENAFGAIADSSNSQFALLGLHEAARVGFEVPRDVWVRAKQYWTNVRNPNRGYFAYDVDGNRPNGSMTCAGISSWIIIEENLADPSRYLRKGKVACCGQVPGDDIVDMAMGWLAKRFSVAANPDAAGGNMGAKYYYLYGMERAGRLSGQRFIGPFDWYREGAAHLLENQSLDGSWHRTDQLENSKDITTSFALLFLSKGRRPIVFGKYKYAQDDNWDLHPPGVHYLTRELEKAWQTQLNWQTVDGNTADVNDLLEAPVLFLSGQDAIQLSDEQKQNLKAYIENGGFVFAEACQGDGCGDNVPFDASFRALVAELFPESQLEPLPAEHPIWTANFPIKPNPEWPVLGLQACCRTSLIYCPRNLACYWQLDRPAFLKRLDNQIVADIVYCRQLGINVAAYATNRELEEKLDRPKLKDNELQMLKDRVLILPKLRHQGGHDEAPNAWRNLEQDVRAQAQLNLNVEKKFIDATTEQLADYPFVFMHGRGKFTFDPKQRDALRKYLERGGFIFADAICSAKDFTDSFRREFGEIFPENALTPIPANHPIWNDEKYGYQIKLVKLHTPDRNSPGGVSVQQTPPLMEGIEIDGRLAVVFSQYDLSCALENAAATQCKGYSRDDAIMIGTNVILYRLRVD